MIHGPGDVQRWYSGIPVHTLYLGWESVTGTGPVGSESKEWIRDFRGVRGLKLGSEELKVEIFHTDENTFRVDEDTIL